MSVELADEQDDPVPAGALRALAESAMAAEGLPPDTELGILLVGPERMAELHTRHLEGTGPTDVLSLPIEDLIPGRPPLPGAGEPPLQLGDVVLCPAVVLDRAAAAGVGFEEHMALLLVHGVLHLLGYDHGEEAAAERMEARERALLSAGDDPMTGLALGIAAVLLVIASAVRAGGASLVRTPRADALRDAADGNIHAERVATLLEDRPRLQPALSAVHSTLLVAAAVPATWALTAIYSGWALLASLVLLAVFLALVADLLPRSWGRARPRRLAYRLSGLLAVAAGLGNRAADLIYDEDEVEEDGAEDQHDAEEMGLISSVLEFTDAVVREVMVPRTDMFVCPASASTDEAFELVMEDNRSRIPVTGEGIDDIVGLLYAKDLLQLVNTEGPKRVGDLMRPAYYVPETKRLSELLREMQLRKIHMAIVIDEFGGTAGLVTIEDVIEELVGEIVDEHDVEEPMVVSLDGGGYLVDARLNVHDLSELLGKELPEEDWDTVGGLMLSLAGRVPEQGETFAFEGFRLTAERVQGRRVAQVRVAGP